jgi:signal transduction histidine kinase
MPRNRREETVFVLAPTGRDAQLIAGTLIETHVPVEVCATMQELSAGIQGGASTVIVAEEALTADSVKQFARLLEEQPTWSDLPIIVLIFAGESTAFTAAKAQALSGLGNVTLLERPVRQDTLKAAVRSAWRARRRQYQLRTRQETLQHAISELEQFAYTASHDLREPLRSIGIFSELLERQYGALLDKPGKQYLDFVRTGARRMEMLVEDLLSYTKTMNDGEEQPAAAQTDANKCLEMAVTNLSHSISEARATVTAEELPTVRIHTTHLYQLFQNLIANAIKYHRHEPPLVHVNALRDGVEWRFAVHDNGIGIDPEYKERIFGLFKRLHNTSQYSGTGIGLAICQRIVQRYGSRIWVESEPGRGSTFFFTVKD